MSNTVPVSEGALKHMHSHGRDQMKLLLVHAEKKFVHVTFSVAVSSPEITNTFIIILL